MQEKQYRNDRNHWLKPLGYAMVMLIGMGLGIFLKGNFGALRFEKRNAIEEIIQLAESKYVDSIYKDSIDTQLATYYLAQLDPHSTYIPPADLVAVNEQLQPNFKGIGIEYQVFRDSIFVSYIMPDGPAAAAGLAIGDILLEADNGIQLSGKHWELDALTKILRGPAETKLQLVIKRGNQQLSKQIKRGNVAVSPIEAAYMLTDTIGYIRIDKFADRTYEAFMQALEPLLHKGMKWMVLDLRGNGGGLLSEAVAIVDEVLAGNKLIVYTEGLHSPRLEYYSKREGLFEQGKITVLIDAFSASASEVVAGALQDWDRAAIIGGSSFGKGLVQQQFRLTNGGAIRLTTAKYFTPLGRNIQKPYDQGKEAYEYAYQHTLQSKVDSQASGYKNGKVYKTAKGKILYASGGIHPDKWLPTNTLHVDSNTALLLASAFLNDFVLYYYRKEQANIASMQSVKELIFQYASKNLWNEMLQYASPLQKQPLLKMEANKKWLETNAIASLARFKWYKTGYYEALNQLDPHFKLIFQ